MRIHALSRSASLLLVLILVAPAGLGPAQALDTDPVTDALQETTDDATTTAGQDPMEGVQEILEAELAAFQAQLDALRATVDELGGAYDDPAWDAWTQAVAEMEEVLRQVYASWDGDASGVPDWEALAYTVWTTWEHVWETYLALLDLADRTLGSAQTIAGLSAEFAEDLAARLAGKEMSMNTAQGSETDAVNDTVDDAIDDALAEVVAGVELVRALYEEGGAAVADVRASFWDIVFASLDQAAGHAEAIAPVLAAVEGALADAEQTAVDTLHDHGDPVEAAAEDAVEPPASSLWDMLYDGHADPTEHGQASHEVSGPQHGGTRDEALGGIGKGTPTPHDLRDHPDHRAYISLDRNWGPTYTTFHAVSLSRPIQDVLDVTWALDAYNLTYAGQGSPEDGHVVKTLRTITADGGPRQDVLGIQVTEPGIHFLTLTVTWQGPEGLVSDRVTTPLYVEATALDRMDRIPATQYYDPSSDSVLSRLLDGDVEGAADHAVAAADRTVEEIMDPDLPTIMVVSDFLLDLSVLDRGGAGGLLNLAEDFEGEILGTIEGADVAGLTDIVYPEAESALGHRVDHVGQTLVETLLTTTAANVVFVRAIDPATGGLDREAIRNGMDVARAGEVDAVLWGLPSAAYLPGLTKNQQRPNFAFSTTPQIGVPAGGALPYGDDGLLALAGYMDVKSVATALFELAHLIDHKLPEGAEYGGLIDALHENLDAVYPVYRDFVREVKRDLDFDRDLQEAFLDLARQGVAVVAPSEDCPDLADEYMTVLGIGHLAGTFTVAPGTAEDGVDPTACKGPDRRPDNHGNGVDLVVDPRPQHHDLLDDLAGGTAVHEAAPVPFIPGSLGASLNAAVTLAAMREGLRSAATPWQSQDLVGMIARHAEDDGETSPWAQGLGFIDLPGVPTEVPDVFSRGTQVVFTPFDHEAGKAIGVVQVMVRGGDHVAAWESAPGEAFAVEGGTQYRFVATGEQGTEKSLERIDGSTVGHMEVVLDHMNFTRLDSETGLATFVLSAHPNATLPGDAWEAAGVAPPREWIFPGLYAGRTWISTPNGILQLPIHIGVGTIVDVHRFLHPDTPVGDTAVCLALPDILGDIGLRRTSHELGTDKLCLYWTNTDRSGVARFYTPLPLIEYRLISWFHGVFAYQDGGGRGEIYPHIKEDIGSFPMPLNLTGITEWLATATDGLGEDVPAFFQDGEGNVSHFYVDTDPDNPEYPIFIDGDLPYPLVHIPINITAPLAIAINWFYRDNMEGDHFLPFPDVGLAEVVEALVGQPLPGVRGLVDGAFPAVAGRLRSGVDGVQTLLQNTYEDVKGPIPDEGIANTTLLDHLLGQPLSKALPTNLDFDPAVCQWGYGHASSPALSDDALAWLDDPSLIGNDPGTLRQEIEGDLAREHTAPGAPFPDTFAMRVRPTLDHLVGLSSNLPICAGYYGFNIPQPNYYPTTVHHSFDYHLEATLLIVCLEAGKSKECFIVVPVGTGGLSIPIGAGDLPGLLPDLTDTDLSTLLDSPRGRAQAAVENTPQTLNGALDYVNGTLGEVIGSLPELDVSLPDSALTLSQDGTFSATVDLVSAGADSGRISYIAVPLFLLGSGILDPVVGLLYEHGVNVTELLVEELELDVDGPIDVDPATGLAKDAIGDLGYLIRDSAEDLLRIQPYVEIDHGVMMMDAWWWDDFFIRAPVLRTPALAGAALPHSQDVQCARSWADRTDPALWQPEDPTDPTTTRFPRDTDDPSDDVTCLAHPVSGEPVVIGGTAGRPDGGFDLAEDWWWLTFPNINRMMFERGLRYWNGTTLQPDLDALEADGYPWGRDAELFEVNMQMWNQHEIRSATPNQIHFHAAQGAPLFDHMMTNSAEHCTVHERQDPASGQALNLAPEQMLPPFDLGPDDGYASDHPDARMSCMEGALAFEEGNRWMLHNDSKGIGIYDPGIGIGSPDLAFLKIIDDLLAVADGINQALWTTEVAWGEVSLSPREAVFDVTGIDPLDLQWWKRDAAPYANRSIYADLFTNSSFMLWSHHQTCEEVYLFHQLLEVYPYWKTACPSLPGPDARAAWARAEALGVSPGWPEGWVPDGWWTWTAPGDVPAARDPASGRWDWDFRRVDPDAPRTKGATVDGWVALDAAPPGQSGAGPGQAWWFRPGITCVPAAFEGRWPADAWPAADNATREATLTAYYDHLYGAGTVADAHIRRIDPAAYTTSGKCGDYNEWRYYVLAGQDFNGGELSKAHRYSHIVQPVWHNGTFSEDVDAWVACQAAGSTGGWGCGAAAPMDQVRDDLASALPPGTFPVPHRTEALQLLDARIAAGEGGAGLRAFRDLVANGTYDDWFHHALVFFGMEHARPDGTQGQDAAEHHVTVPLARDPDGWFGGGDATEWNAFYRSLELRKADWPRGPEANHVGQLAVLQDVMPVYAELLRAWLEGDLTSLSSWYTGQGATPPAWLGGATADNPFWDGVAGQEVPYWELHRPRHQDGRGPCPGLQMKAGEHNMCMRTEESFDAGDLSPFAGHWGREAKWKETYIPQGSAYARFNRDHLLPVPYNVEGALAAGDTATASIDRLACGAAGGWRWEVVTDLNLSRDGFTETGGTWTRATCLDDPTPWTFWAEHAPFHAAVPRPADPVADPAGAAAWGSEVLESYYAGAFRHADTGRWLAADPNDRVIDPMVLTGPIGGVSRFRQPDATGNNTDQVSVAVYSTYDTGGRTFDGQNYAPECWGGVGGLPLVPYGSYTFIGGPPPFPTTFYDEPPRFGGYNHGATDRSGRGETDPHPEYGTGAPVPTKPAGYACIDPATGEYVPARSEFDYIPQRLTYWMQGGYRHDDRVLPPPRPFGLSGGMGEECVVTAGVCLKPDVFGLLPPLLEALLRDLLEIADAGVGDLGQALPHVGVPERLPVSVTALSQQAEAALPEQVRDLLNATKADVLDLVDEILPDLDLGGPIVPLTRLIVADDVAYSELAVHHDHRFPMGTQGVFVVSEDGGRTWTVLSGRATPGFTGTSPGGSLALLETTHLRGKEVVLGAQILGQAWRDAVWNVGRMTALPAGAPGLTVPGLPAWGGVAEPAPKADGRVDAATLATWSDRAVVIDAPLVVAEGQDLTFDNLTLLPEKACDGRHCPILVEGTLRLQGGAVRPMQGVDGGAPAAGQGLVLVVTGRLEAVGTLIEGLVGGLPIPGGDVVLEDCWMRGNYMGPHAILGSLTVRGCVIDDAVLGVYALGSHVRIEDNVFHRPVRTAGLFDGSWGVVRDNIVLHSKQSGFLARDPLGSGNLAVFGNTVEETGIGVGFHLALEDRLLPLDPLELLPDILPVGVELPVRTGVPLEARNRVQANAFEWNTLEAMASGALTAPAFYGNDATHNNIGAYPHLLSNGTFWYNDLPSDVYAWRDAPGLLHGGHSMHRADLPPRPRHPLPDDGQTWAGLWLHGLRELHSLFAFVQLTLQAPDGSELPIDPADIPLLGRPLDARFNHWGPGDTVFAPGPWPRDVVADPALVDVSSPSPVPVSRPALAMLTGPGYGGGLLLDLETDRNVTVPRPVDLVEDVLATLPGTSVIEDGLAIPGIQVPELPLPLGNVTIAGLEPRPTAIELDVPAGDVVEVRVRETHYRTDLPTLEELLGQPVVGTDLATLVETLGPLLPSLLEPVAPTVPPTMHTFALEGASSLRHEFTFQDILDAYVHWEVTEVRLSPDAYAKYAAEDWFVPTGGDWIEADGVVTKDAVVYNSLVWPLITDLVLLANNLVTGTLEEDLRAILDVAPGAPFALDVEGLAKQGIPVVPLPDGVLPFDGGLSLLGAARDQDPVRWYEARLVFDADAGILDMLGLPEVTELGSGFSMDRVLGLVPEHLPDGVEVRLEMRAMDASGLVSPWTGIRLLPDLRIPVPQVDVERCIVDLDDDGFGRIDYNATEPGFDDGRRSSGLQGLGIHVTTVNLVNVTTDTEWHNATVAEWDHAERTYTMPASSDLLVDGAIHLVRAAARDRAGHAANSATEVIVDLSAPRIELNETLQGLKDLIEALLSGETPYLGVPDASSIPGAVLDPVTGEISYWLGFEVSEIPAQLDERIDATVGRIGYCGLAEVRVQAQTEENGPWQDLVTPIDLDGEESFSSDDLVSPIRFDLASFEGDWLNLRVYARDRGGNEADVTTGNVLVDLTGPTITLPDIPVCLPLEAPQQYAWTAQDPVPAGGEASGIDAAGTRLKLKGGGFLDWTGFQTLGADGTATVDLSGLPAATYRLRIEALDRAKNDRVSTPLTFVQKPGVPQILPGDLLADLQGSHFVSLLHVDTGLRLPLVADILHDAASCGLVEAVLEMSVDGGAWSELKRWTSGGALVDEDFEDGIAQNWTLGGLWRVSDRCGDPPSGTRYLGYHNAFDCHYDTGARTSGDATFQVDLTDAIAAELSFQHWFEVESGGGSWDQMRVEARQAGASWTTLRSWDSSDGTSTGWQPVQLDLTGYTGGLVDVRFRFDSVDAVANAFGGWRIDDVAVHVQGIRLAHDLPVPDLEGQSVRFQVRAEDQAGDTNAWSTTHLKLVDITDPLPKIVDLADLPPCVADGVGFDWGGDEGLSADVTGAEEASGLLRAWLFHMRPDGTWVTADDSDDLTVQPHRGPPSWTKSIDLLGLADGTHGIAVLVTDQAGNDVNTTLYSFTVDGLAPAITAQMLLAAVADAPYLNAALDDAFDSTLKALVEDVGCGLSDAALEISLDDGATWQPLDGTPAGSPPALEHVLDTASYQAQNVRFRVVATDGAGNAAVPWTSQQNTLVDIVAPAITLPDIPSWIGRAGLDLDWSVTDSGAGTDDTWYELRHLGALVDDGRRNELVALASEHDGKTLSIGFHATDLAGNADELPAGTIGVDLTDALPILEPVPCSGSDTSIPWGAADLGSGVASAWLDIRGGSYSTWTQIDLSGTLAAPGSWQTTRSITLAEGTYDLRVRTLDAAGNERLPATADATFRVDATDPVIMPGDLLPDLEDTPYIGAALAALDSGIASAALDDGTGCGLVDTVLEVRSDGGAWQVLDQGPGSPGAKTDSLASDLGLPSREGERVQVRVRAEDEAGNTAQWIMEQEALVDLTSPATTIGGLRIEVGAVQADWTSGDTAAKGDASGAASVRFTRYVRAPTAAVWSVDAAWTASASASATLTDTNVSTGQYVRYGIQATDHAGNTGAEVNTTATLYVDFNAPTLGLVEPVDAGRMLVDARDLGIFYLDPDIVVDLGSGHAGATVRSAGAREPMAYGVNVSHADADMPYRVEVMIDGAVRLAKDGSGALDWPVLLDDAAQGTSMGSDSLERVLVRVTGENGLSSEAERLFYFPAAEPLVADEGADWGTTGSVSWEGGLLHVDASTASATAAWRREVPAPRLFAQVEVLVDARTSGRFDVLGIQESSANATSTRAGLYLDGTGMGLNLDRAGHTAVALGASLTLGKPHRLDLAVGPDSVTVFLDGKTLGTWPLAAAAGLGMEQVALGGSGADAVFMGPTVRSLSPGFQALFAYESFTDDEPTVLTRWTKGGDGVAGVEDDSLSRVLQMVPDIGGGGMSVSSPSVFNATFGSHAVLHFKVESAPTVVMALKDPSGTLLMYAYGDGNTLYATDGKSGTAVEVEPVGPISRSWHRLDVFLFGTEYLIVLDQTHALRADLFAMAGSARLELHNDGILPVEGSELSVDRIRFDIGDGSKDVGFTRPLSASDWNVRAPDGGLTVETTQDGHLGKGRLAVASDGVAYIDTALDGLDGAIGAEASFRPLTVSTVTDGIPDRQAALAGVSGPASSPTLDWGLVLGKIGLDHRQWALFYVDSTGREQQVTTAWTALDPLWHMVRIRYDPAAATLDIEVDDGAHTALVTGVPSWDRLAVGDVWGTGGTWTGDGTGYYDNVAVYATD